MLSKLFQDIINDCCTTIDRFKKLWVVYIFWRIKRKAFRLHKKYNCQIFVVKIKGKVKLMSKYQFKKRRQKGKIAKQFTATELKAISLYYTPEKYDKKRAEGPVR